MASYLLATERLDEAAMVAPCAARFAAAELLTDDERNPVGRYVKGALGLSPSLGRMLEKPLRNVADETRAALRGVVLDAVAFGYVAAIDSEGTQIEAGEEPRHFLVRFDRTPEDVWNYWVVYFAGDGGDAFDVRFGGTSRTSAINALLLVSGKLGYTHGSGGGPNSLARRAPTGRLD